MPECSIFTSTIRNPPRYEALSYVWGDPKVTNAIIVNGETFQVTLNLKKTLRYLRDLLEVRVLWVDAICINQRDPIERGHQVTFMKDTYSRCWTYLLWLGQGNVVMDLGMRMVDRLLSKHRAAEEQYEPEDNHTMVQRLNEDIKKVAEELMEPARMADDHHFYCLKAVFLFADLWERVWIMQEIAYAPNPVLIVGHYTLPWNSLEKLFFTADKFPGAFDETLTNSYDVSIPSCEVVFSVVQAIQHQRLITRSIKTGKDSDLLDVLARFQKTYSTDPKDKLFALLALTSNPLELKPDYLAAKMTVFTKFAAAHINHVQNLDILCQSRWRHYFLEEDITYAVPSWVPDLEQRWPVPLIFSQRGIFKAGGLECNVPCNVTDKDRLIVEGVNLGEVNRSYTMHGWELTADWIPDELKVSETLMYTPSILSRAENGFQAFWRTLLSDCVRYPTRRLNEDEYASYGSAFDSWKRGDITADELPYFDLKGELEQRDFLITENGLYCLAPSHVRKSDFVVVLKGAKIPVVLRKITEKSKDKSEYIFAWPSICPWINGWGSDDFG
ncbi:hypothetical protein SS1G_02744 [Sclerotinia sclerotiorum 1980 UF-70]|nr:hypothetical protein SS1G_02744 [Sclerotinia sclerotiorum 1980 UF-70]EDN99886.1 hypothetical protein SS1G_02744 [Sclerotinia sclerotiorum 1980 UF-70]